MASENDYTADEVRARVKAACEKMSFGHTPNEILAAVEDAILPKVAEPTLGQTLWELFLEVSANTGFTVERLTDDQGTIFGMFRGKDYRLEITRAVTKGKPSPYSEVPLDEEPEQPIEEDEPHWVIMIERRGNSRDKLYVSDTHDACWPHATGKGGWSSDPDDAVPYGSKEAAHRILPKLRRMLGYRPAVVTTL